MRRRVERGGPTWTALLVAGLALPSASAGQVIQGRVVDGASDEPIFGVEVTVLDAEGTARGAAVTDVSGGFLLAVPESPSFSLHATHIAYATFRSDLLDRPAVDVRVTIRLGMQAIDLAPLTVTAARSAEEYHLQDFQRRRTDPTNAGWFVTREDIRRRGAINPTSLVVGAPGISLQRVIDEARAEGMDSGLERNIVALRTSDLRTTGLCIANVFVDGVRVNQTKGTTLDDVLMTDQIAGIEVYSRPITAPPQYLVDPGCGVVLFWTARPDGGDGGWSFRRIATGAGVVLGLVVAGLSLVN